jgi:ADP-ribosyl-[dinitrogen reductase] hydrolase
VSKLASDIQGTGYVVECLEAALWCFTQTQSFKEAVLLAANLGDDADTTAAVCGQIAGAHYGVGDIPTTWLEHLTMGGLIEDLANRLLLGPAR